MKIIKHRVNSIKQLKKLDDFYGVEVDLRSNNKLILNHDPFSKSESFEKYLKLYNHEFMIINLKESGLIKECEKILQKYNFKNYFYLDATIPEIITTRNVSKQNMCIRYSYYENIKNVIRLSNFADWLWVDYLAFKKIPKADIKILETLSLKICIVSPELVIESTDNEIEQYYTYLKNLNFSIDLVCTKRIKLWKNLFFNS